MISPPVKPIKGRPFQKDDPRTHAASQQGTQAMQQTWQRRNAQPAPKAKPKGKK